MLPSDYDFEAHRELVGMQPGDVPVTYADSSGLEEDYEFKPNSDITVYKGADAEAFLSVLKELKSKE